MGHRGHAAPCLAIAMADALQIAESCSLPEIWQPSQAYTCTRVFGRWRRAGRGQQRIRDARCQAAGNRRQRPLRQRGSNGLLRCCR